MPQNIIKLCFVGNEECGKEYCIDKDGHIDFGSDEEVFKNMEQKDNPLIIFYKMLKNTDFPRAKRKPNGCGIKFYEDNSCILKGSSKKKLSANSLDRTYWY